MWFHMDQVMGIRHLHRDVNALRLGQTISALVGVRIWTWVQTRLWNGLAVPWGHRQAKAGPGHQPVDLHIDQLLLKSM